MVTAFFDLAELRARNHEPMYMKDWIVEIDNFAKRYGQEILSNAGSVSHQQALEKAEREYQKLVQCFAPVDYPDTLETAISA